MKESDFQKELIDELHTRFNGCIILKNDPNYIQGVPDLTMLYGEHWCTFECKKSKSANHQPNQDYYVERMNEMSHSYFIYPENKEDVLRELEQSFRFDREARGT